jgi:hypothetical protein
MKINIEVNYIINDTGIYRSGSFKVKKDAVHTSYEWIRQIQKEHGYDLTLEKVIVDGKNDITEELNHLLNE